MSGKSAHDAVQATLLQARELVAHPRPDLGWHYALGTALQDLRRSGGGREWPVQRVTAMLGLSVASYYQHLKFVELFRLAEIAKQKLPWTTLVALLSVDKPAERTHLLHAAVEANWSLTRMRREIRRVQAPKEAGIRKRKVSSDITELWRLEALAVEWTERYELWRTNRKKEEGDLKQLIAGFRATPIDAERPPAHTPAEQLEQAGESFTRLAKATKELAELIRTDRRH